MFFLKKPSLVVLLSFKFAAQVDLIGAKTDLPSITDGGLSDTFLAAQFHFHWGSVDTQGSEHTIDGNKYSMEVNVSYLKHSIHSGTEAFPLRVRH